MDKNSSLKIINLESVDSTNEYLFSLAKKGEPEITIVRANYQTLGKGRLGRKWVSPKNKGLYLSFLLRPDKNVKVIPLIGIMIALACVKALKEKLSLKIKWPNDLLVDNKKIGGILLEASSLSDVADFIVVGLGLNINSSLDELVPGATSFFIETKVLGEMDQIFNRIVDEVLKLYEKYRQELFDDIVEEAATHLITLGKGVVAKMKNAEIRGRAFGLDKYGALLLKDKDDKIIRVTTSEVIHLR